MVKKMEKVFIHLKMEMYIKENIKMIKEMEKEYIHLMIIKIRMKGNGKMTKSMEKEFINIIIMKVVYMYMKAIMKMVRKTVKELLYLMEMCMKGNLKMML